MYPTRPSLCSAEREKQFARNYGLEIRARAGEGVFRGQNHLKLDQIVNMNADGGTEHDREVIDDDRLVFILYIP